MPFDKLNNVSGQNEGSLLAKYREKDKFLQRTDTKIGESDTFLIARPSKGEILIVANKEGVPLVIAEDLFDASGVARMELGASIDNVRFEAGSKQLNPVGDKIPSTALTPQRTVTQIPPWEKAMMLTKLLNLLPL